ncbi:fimbrial protein [Citrobacter arsenatis]|uniref:Fimbrial protein n=1 Tax=Citrobacter arsenatis TaxID=2546350 RepID=A0A4P6WIP8_9ENTR|nr:fimbrial protein [Citrobacter arsenatis]QBM22043.1 fimbrial protein [Citrobacter arsenatis]
MLRVIMLLLIFGGGYLTMFPARAAFSPSTGTSCGFEGGSQLNISIPKLAIPADTPNGTVLYSSPKITKRIHCEGSVRTRIVVATTADYNAFLSQRNGVKLTVYIDGVAYDTPGTRDLGYTTFGPDATFDKDVSVWFEVKSDSSMGQIPVEGTLLSGGFESLYVMPYFDYTARRGVISLYTPNITYIPCTMEVSVIPDTIDFGAVKTSDMEKGMRLQRKFTTLIKKSKGCTIAVSAPFGINLYFDPATPVINADGSLNLNNGLGLSISDTSGKYIPYNSAWKIDDVKVDSILKNYFTANLQKVSGQDVKTGPFSADVVVRLNYY